MPVPYSPEDLNLAFDSPTLTRGRSLALLGQVEPRLDAASVVGVVEDRGIRRTATLTPVDKVWKVAFEMRCTCRQPACTHLAATAIAALDRFPALRGPEQDSFTETLAAAPAPEPRRLAFEVSAAAPPDACLVSAFLVGERSGRIEPTTPRRIAMDPAAGRDNRAIGRLLGGGDASRVPVPAKALDETIQALAKSGLARWKPGGRLLHAGDSRGLDMHAPPPPRTALLRGADGSWYVDTATGAVGRVHWRRPAAPRQRGRKAQAVRAAPPPELAAGHAIVERAMRPVLSMHRLECPDDYGHMRLTDVLSLDFDYGGMLAEGHDERQFLRVEEAGGPVFVRRDRAAETEAFDLLLREGFVQMRIGAAGSAKGRRVLMFRGIEAAEAWHRFVALRVPSLEAQGWESRIGQDFGPRLAGPVGVCDVRVGDAGTGKFSIKLDIDIDGVSHPLLPILSRVMERGGLEAAQVVDGDLLATLEDGRVARLPVERIQPLLAIMGDLIEAAGRLQENELILPEGEAETVLALEDLLPTRWENAAAISAYARMFRGAPQIETVPLPEGFRATLRPYQQHGVDWLQHLSAHGLNGFLADEMGLGKTAQTIAHLSVEHAAGRMEHPALIVMPTSLISNWAAELEKFAPHFKVAVLHGLARHERRADLDQMQVAITTYAVLARDVEVMKDLDWHIVVLDEAQAIKSPEAKATRAVCQLRAKHKMCLSGTPIENNLEELWSQFAFLMPGLFGERRSFVRRFRTPIEKKGNASRRVQLVRRIRPFILRRTKAEVAAELPPKHTILRRITLAPAQREVYETIRATLHDKVRAQIAERSLAASRIVVLDALLKLRQACCDPRLVRLPSAREVDASSKLEDLLHMLQEMVPEGRRILLFSQFTSMLDLVKPRLREAGIGFVELRGDTRDRAEPVRAFQAGEVPLFLISLKAGGRGLNLTAADTVIHYDPWWNPAVEDQASDRAHRIGQTRPVFIYKLIAADTVEERILELQQRKAELAGIAFNEVGDLAGLNLDDVDYLFGEGMRVAA